MFSKFRGEIRFEVFSDLEQWQFQEETSGTSDLSDIALQFEDFVS